MLYRHCVDVYTTRIRNVKDQRRKDLAMDVSPNVTLREYRTRGAICVYITSLQNRPIYQEHEGVGG